MANRWGKNGNSDRLYFGAPKSLQMVTATMKLKDACSYGFWPVCELFIKQINLCNYKTRDLKDANVLILLTNFRSTRYLKSEDL